VKLCQLPALVFFEEQRVMAVDRLGQVEKPLECQLRCGAGSEIAPANDVRDSESGIVDDAGQLISDTPITTAYNGVAHLKRRILRKLDSAFIHGLDASFWQPRAQRLVTGTPTRCGK